MRSENSAIFGSNVKLFSLVKSFVFNSTHETFLTVEKDGIVSLSINNFRTDNSGESGTIRILLYLNNQLINIALWRGEGFSVSDLPRGICLTKNLEIKKGDVLKILHSNNISSPNYTLDINALCFNGAEIVEKIN